MKIFIRYGHEYLTNGNNTSANGVLNEKNDVIDKYAPYLSERLHQAGHECKTYRVNYAHSSSGQALNAGIADANNWGADLFISCHANAGGGTGSEVYYQTKHALSKNIATEVSKVSSDTLGLRNRGAKVGDSSYAETRETNMPAVILEPLFVDSQSDCDAFNSVGGRTLGRAMADAILSQI